MAKARGFSYRDAGVDIDAGNRLVDLIKPLVKATARAGADAEIGGFGGVFDLKRAGYRDPLLVAATDGVGKAWISGLVPPQLQGRGQGIYQGLTGGAVLVAGVWAGLFWGKDGTVPLLVSGFAAAALLPAFMRTRSASLSF